MVFQPILVISLRHTFYVGGGVGYDDVDEEMDLSEANILVSEVSKLSAGAGICRGP